MAYTTTLNAIRKHSPYHNAWIKLLKTLGKTEGDDEPLTIDFILASNGLDDALWCLCALPESDDNAVRLLVCDLVELTMKFVPDDEPRPQEALNVARRFAKGEATREQLEIASNAARVAALSATSLVAWIAGMDASGAAAARVATWAAAKVATWAAAGATETDAARDEQEAIFRSWLKSNQTQVLS